MLHKIKIYSSLLITAFCLPLILHSAQAATPDEIATFYVSSPIGARTICSYSYSHTLPKGHSTKANVVINSIALSNDGRKVRYQTEEVHTGIAGKVFMNVKYTSNSQNEAENRRIKANIESDSVQIDKPDSPSAVADILAYYKSLPAYYYDYKDIKFTASGSYIITSKYATMSDITCRHAASEVAQRRRIGNLPTFWLELSTKLQLARWLVL
ncbi:hypothetical protein [Serratia sp. DD3]|uniref:hypothetical protein n=1 Tax=Serratia sp. DD3 TaxID=1410619 RepID=UPI0003C52941|nr:hypothetical protein [Serratia sp. DD3]KEY60824.1 hypothetical protein SRDD_02030 [Serratia sp. DD3]